MVPICQPENLVKLQTKRRFPSELFKAFADELCSFLSQPDSASHCPGSDDALLRLQESLQARWADLEGRRSTPPPQGHRVMVGGGGDGVVLRHFLCAARWQRGGGAWWRRRSFQGANGWCVKPFEVGEGVRGHGRWCHVWRTEWCLRARRRGGGAVMTLQRKQEVVQLNVNQV